MDYDLGEFDWCQVHFNAIDSVSRDACIKECRRYGIPLSNDLLKSEVEEKLIAFAFIVLMR